MAKLKTSVLYGVFSMDRFLKITTNNKALFKMANVPMIPNATLRPIGILRKKKKPLYYFMDTRLTFFIQTQAFIGTQYAVATWQ